MGVFRVATANELLHAIDLGRGPRCVINMFFVTGKPPPVENSVYKCRGYLWKTCGRTRDRNGLGRGKFAIFGVRFRLDQDSGPKVGR